MRARIRGAVGQWNGGTVGRWDSGTVGRWGSARERATAAEGYAVVGLGSGGGGYVEPLTPHTHTATHTQGGNSITLAAGVDLNNPRSFKNRTISGTGSMTGSFCSMPEGLSHELAPGLLYRWALQ